jgi:hypothetical protein
MVYYFSVVLVFIAISRFAYHSNLISTHEMSQSATALQLVLASVFASDLVIVHYCYAIPRSLTILQAPTPLEQLYCYHYHYCYYYYRTGRTGRAGRKGINCVLMCPGAEEREAVLLENEYGFQMSRVSVPGASSMAEIAGNEVRLLRRNIVENFRQELYFPT